MADRVVTTGVDPHVTTNERIKPIMISWGAIFAGLVTVISITWLMSMLGSAIGVSIVDVSDGEAIGDGLATGAIIWMVVSALAAYFVGSLLAARVAGTPDETVGMLHGLTMWSASVVLMLVLTYMGVASLVQTGANMASAGAALMANAGEAVASAAAKTDEAAKAAADAAEEAPPEIQQTVEQATNELTTNLAAQLRREFNEVVASADLAGQDVTAEEIQRAVENLDRETLQQVATQLISGRPEAAKDTLAANTNLNERQISELINVVQRETQERIDEFRRAADRAMETASNYAQAVMWTVFVSSALGLAVSMCGGMMGTKAVERVYGHGRV